MLKASPERRARWSSLGRGFRQRNPLVLVAAALLALGALLVFQSALVHGGLTLVSEGRLLRITNDDYLHVAYRVAELKKEPSQQRTIYLFGGSGTMECFVDQQSLGAAGVGRVRPGRARRQPGRPPAEHGHVAGARRQSAGRPRAAGHRPGAHPHDHRPKGGRAVCSPAGRCSCTARGSSRWPGASTGRAPRPSG